MTTSATDPEHPTDRAPVARPDVVLFDFDGTVIDSRRSFARSINHILRAYGKPEQSLQSLYKYLGPPTGVTFRELISEDPQIIDAAVAEYREHQLTTHVEDVIVFDGVRELLATLHGQVTLAVATSKLITMTERLLAALDLRHYFDLVCGSPAEAVAEPKEVTFARAFAQLGSPTRAVMIGDRRFDVESAAASGVPTIGVVWGAESEQELAVADAELRSAGAVTIVSRPDEIPPLLGL